ncbi:MAG: hypothetical protein DRP75_04355 [Candidatus Omnitrophota bacterium]|nr:MAG: hypothetical protein DRP75_04355 [Candidatus Omnitrophota bacterium]RLC40266.1 MAG: hypothetical protein DRH51_05880 [Candidatus Coatesbacteria bacterium]
MGNQHPLEIDLAYLAGIIDGEGCITIHRTAQRRKNSDGKTLQPMLTITNCDSNIIARCQEILNRLEINGHLKSSSIRRPSSWKTCYWFTVSGFKIKRILDAIKPYLVGKQGQCELVLNFINSRLSKGTPKAFPYDENEKEIVNQIHQLNQRGSETERRPCSNASK